MQQIAQFFKVSEEQFVRDWCAATRRSADEAKKVYQNIRLPRRATKGSAGYDFFAPESFTLVPHETILIPTGIRVMIEDGWVLSLYPRSGLGFRHRLQLDNTVGIIDSDYFEAKNEGHILIKMTSDDHKGNLPVAAGDGFAQGIFLPFGITVTMRLTVNAPVASAARLKRSNIP
ncbi:MAG: deoxyuridine 5'-triphosphate nucleotidohydrolase [Butyricicoccus sp.]